MDLLGLKWTIISAEVGYVFYIAANIKPLPLLMYISKRYMKAFYRFLFKYFITTILDNELYSYIILLERKRVVTDLEF